jgi:Membrane bound O-acyl transferase family
MSAYLPLDPARVRLAGAVLLATLLAGLALSRLHPGLVARTVAWMLVVLATAGVERLCAGEPPGVRMLAVSGALFLGMKAVVSVEAQSAGGKPLEPWRWLAFAVAWPGMRSSLFTTAGMPPLPGAGLLMRGGLRQFLMGWPLAFTAWLVWQEGREMLGPLTACILATVLFLVGLSLMLHFGAFNVLAGLWRLAGVDCRPLFRAPLLARSLTEFWGRRWNLAFAEMTALAIYRPLSARLGRGTAMAGAFLCSGLLHELAISVPVLAGFGLPLSYFALQGVLVLAERRLERTRWAMSRWGWLARVWTLGWLVLPLPALFHPWFLHGVVWPLIGTVW